MSDERGEMNEEQQLRDEPESRPRSRRELFKVAGAAAGAIAGAKMLSPSDAKATDHAPLNVGDANTGTLQTKLTSTVSFPHPANPPDGAFRVDAQFADYAIYGTTLIPGTNPPQYGAGYGVAGIGGAGVLGVGGSAGGVFAGSVVAINLDPQANPGFPHGQAFKGDLAVDSDGILWFCVVGSPETQAPFTDGVWIKLSHVGVRYLAKPVRVYSSGDPGQNKLTIGTGSTANPRTIQITGVVPAGATEGVPANAVGVLGNLTITQGEALLFATVWPSGPWPGTSNINVPPGFDLANSFNIGLNPDGSGTIKIAASSATHAIIDISGYIL